MYCSCLLWRSRYAPTNQQFFDRIKTASMSSMTSILSKFLTLVLFSNIILRDPFTISKACDPTWLPGAIFLLVVYLVCFPLMPNCCGQSGVCSMRTRLSPLPFSRKPCSNFLWCWYFLSLLSLLPVWVKYHPMSSLHESNKYIPDPLPPLVIYLFTWYLHTFQIYF